MGYWSKLPQYEDRYRQMRIREAEEMIEKAMLQIEEEYGVAITRSQAAGGICGWSREYEIVSDVYRRAYRLFGQTADDDRSAAYYAAFRAVCEVCQFCQLCKEACR